MLKRAAYSMLDWIYQTNKILSYPINLAFSCEYHHYFGRITRESPENVISTFNFGLRLFAIVPSCKNEFYILILGKRNDSTTTFSDKRIATTITFQLNHAVLSFLPQTNLRRLRQARQKRAHFLRFFFCAHFWASNTFFLHRHFCWQIWFWHQPFSYTIFPSKLLCTSPLSLHRIFEASHSYFSKVKIFACFVAKQLADFFCFFFVQLFHKIARAGEWQRGR